MRFWIFVISFFLISHTIYAQTFLPKGQFNTDSVKIGEVMAYTLWIEYPRNANIIFPDSLYDFGPFELEKKTEFETRSDSISSFDSVIYYLTTFEIDPIQRLSLPIYQVGTRDSVAYFAEPDSIYLQELIQQIPDSINLKENSAYQEVSMDFNYPYLVFGISIFVLVIIAVLLIFGKQIRRKIKRYRLNKNHQRFIKKYELLISGYNDTKSATEGILTIWKKYMEKLENRPFTKLTTKEITLFESDEHLKENLKVIDRKIYSDKVEKNILSSFKELRNYTDRRLHDKLELIEDD